MKLDYQRLGRYVLIANLIITGLVVYIAQGLVFGEPVLIDDTRLLAPIKPSRTAEPRGKSIYQPTGSFHAPTWSPASPCRSFRYPAPPPRSTGS